MKKRKYVCNIPPEAQCHWSSLMLSAKSKFSSSISNSKLHVLEQDSQWRWWHPVFRTGSSPHYRKINSATQPSSLPQVTRASAELSVHHWFPGNPAMERVGHRRSAQCLLSDFPNDTKAAAVLGMKKKVPYYTSQKSSKDYTTQLGSQTQMGFRKQRASERRHIKHRAQGSNHGTGHLKNMTSSCKRRLNHRG